MPEPARAVARLLDLDSLGPGPVNIVLHEAIRTIAKHMRARAAAGGGEMVAIEDPVGVLDDERAWRVEVEPEAVVLAAMAEQIKQVFDRALDLRRASRGSDEPSPSGRGRDAAPSGAS